MTTRLSLARAGDDWASPACSTRVYRALAETIRPAATRALHDQAWRDTLARASGRDADRVRAFPQPAAEDIYRRLLPVLSTCYSTLGALESASPSPVHGRDLPRLLTCLSTSLRTCFGIRADQQEVKAVLYGLMRAFSAAGQLDQQPPGRVHRVTAVVQEPAAAPDAAPTTERSAA